MLFCVCVQSDSSGGTKEAEEVAELDVSFPWSAEMTDCHEGGGGDRNRDPIQVATTGCFT